MNQTTQLRNTETSKLIKRFTSPINEDDGTRNRFIGHAESDMELVIHADGKTGHIEWVATFIDGPSKGQDIVTEIGIYVNNNRLVDYDGVFEMPEEAIQLLEENGIDATYAKV